MINLAENIIFHERYQLTQLLGAGAFSEVWKALDQKTGTVVALKIYAPDKGIDQDGIELFAEEYRNTNELAHPNILRTNHFDVCGNSPYLVLPYCKGKSLSAWLAKKYVFVEKDIAEIIAQIGSALAYIHQSKDGEDNIIVHKDIKPANILIRDEHLGKYLLADFGISSRMKQTVARSVLGSMSNINSYNSFTPAYAPPEVSRSLPSPAGDIFSLGITLLELLYGKPLPYSQPLGQILDKHRELPELPPIPNRFSDPLCALIISCLAVDKYDRPLAADLAQKAENYLQKGTWPQKYVSTESINREIVDNVLNKIDNNIEDDDTIPVSKPDIDALMNSYKKAQEKELPDTNQKDEHEKTPLISDNESTGSKSAPILDEKPIPPPPSRGKEKISPPSSDEGSESAHKKTTNAPQKRSSTIPIIAAVFVAGALLAGAWLTGIIPHGDNRKGASTADNATIWQQSDIVAELPELYKTQLTAFYASLDPVGKKFKLLGRNDWALVDFKMGSQPSLACIFRDQSNGPSMARLLIWHPDQQGNLKLDEQISPMSCQECTGIDAKSASIPTICAASADAASSAKVVTMPYDYLRTNEPIPRVIYHTAAGNLGLCYSK